MSYKILKPQLKKSIKAVLFDMDGVVLDTEKLYTRFWLEAITKCGYKITKEEVLGLRSLNRVNATKDLEDLFKKKIDYDLIHNLRIELMDKWILENGVEAKPGIYELLDYLEVNKIPFAITTSSPMERIKRYLTPLGLFERFKHICTAYEVKNGKPAPDIYLYGAKTLGIDPSKCLALEDSHAGLLSAYQAKALNVMIPDQDLPKENDLEIAFAISDSLKDIISLIEELNR